MSDFLPIYIFCGLACLFASLTVVIKSAFASSLAASLFSTSLAILYFFLNSPDVSMTEVSVNVFLSTAIFLMTARTVRVETFESPTNLKLIISFLLFAGMLLLSYIAISTIGVFGEIKELVEGSGGMHLLLSYKEFEIPNVVTTILASYRGFDTMGETIIILTAAVGVFLILNTKNSKFNSL